MPGKALALATLTEQMVSMSFGLIALVAVGFLLLEAVYLLVWALFVTCWREERGRWETRWERRGRAGSLAGR